MTPKNQTEETTDSDELITKLEAKQAIRDAYEEKKEEWKSGDVVVKEMGHLYSLAVQRISEVDPHDE